MAMFFVHFKRRTLSESTCFLLNEGLKQSTLVFLSIQSFDKTMKVCKGSTILYSIY